MTKQEIMKEVVNIFKEVFDDENLNIVEETNSDDIDDWDSIEQINLLISMEKRFRIRFVINEIANLSNVGDMVDLIERKINS